jgi:protein TonB
MRESFLRSEQSVANSSDNLIQRIQGNLRDALTPTNWKVSSANGAPLHLLRFEKSSRERRAQGASILTHAAMITVLALIALHPIKDTNIPEGTSRRVFQHLSFPPHFLPASAGTKPDLGSGSGGGRVPIPAISGTFAPLASIQLVRPSLPPKEDLHLPVPPTIFDPDAAAVLTSISKIGLPWMKEDTNSPGPGDSNTIGSSDGNTMGDGTRDGPGGRGDSPSKYRDGVTFPRCSYCPDPQYTDEAREAKLQGKVTLQVLVGADGRALQVHIVQGMGMGLEERAEQAIRGWKFVPAHNAAQRPTQAWITVEAVFRLF